MGRILGNIWAAEKERRGQIEPCYRGPAVVELARVHHAFWPRPLRVKGTGLRNGPGCFPPPHCPVSNAPGWSRRSLFSSDRPLHLGTSDSSQDITPIQLPSSFLASSPPFLIKTSSQEECFQTLVKCLLKLRALSFPGAFVSK